MTMWAYISANDAALDARAEVFRRGKTWGHLPAAMTFEQFLAAQRRGDDPFIRRNVPLGAMEAFRPERLDFEREANDDAWMVAAWAATVIVVVVGAILVVGELL